ncbi:sulfotransferase family 2 domain-containing protein [Fulvivirga sediminis]|uniref:Sulfotransferase family 2 domain-containing protein n=1 Tax=Fulvivirga sediminis TaxID=2803949 RepID=A0A937K2U4_9BACT|nr:sulfotransferase family 2 domain-containing protein [Fulvivirga sediminis]MBL3658735.1 sulfotransferase family 2 domain-containing protein [Fulvivirga sediminis]
MLISHSHKFIFVHIPKVAGSSISHALIPHVHYNLCIDNEERENMVSFFDQIRDIKSHENLSENEAKTVNELISHIGKVSDRQFVDMYNDSDPGIFAKLLPSYLNDQYPEVYSEFLLHDTAKAVRDKIPTSIFNDYFKFAVVRDPLEWLVSLYYYCLQKKGTYLHKYIVRLGSFEGYINYLYQCKSDSKTDNIFGEIYWETLSDYLFDDDDNCMVDCIIKMESIHEDFARVGKILGIEAELPHKNSSKHDHYLDHYTDETYEKAKFIMSRDLKLLKYKEDLSLEEKRMSIC